jgi:hypothetical protein
MKKSLMIIFVLLALPGVLAVDFEINASYSQGETAITKISGNFLSPLSKANIFFYEEHVRIPFEYGVSRIGGEYFLYFITSGKPPGNYSVSIENVKYMAGSAISEEDIVRNFSLTADMADFSVSPGFIVTSEPFLLEIQNLQDSEISVEVSTKEELSAERELFISLPENFKQAVFSLNSGEIKKINFNLGPGNPSVQEITLKSENLTYSIPVSLSTSREEFQLSESFEFVPSDMVFALPTKSEIKRIVYFLNTGDKDIEDVSFTLSDSLAPFVKPSVKEVKNLSAHSNVTIELLISSDAAAEIQGTLKAKVNETLDSFFISLKFSENVTLIQNGTTDVLSCEELDGLICDYEEEECSGDVIKAKDNVCCVGSCKKLKQSSGVGRVIAIILISLVLLVFVWFYFAKYKKAKRPVDLLKIAKGRK